MTFAPAARACCATLFTLLATLLVGAPAEGNQTSRELRLLVASGVPAERAGAYLDELDRLAQSLKGQLPAANHETRAEAIHAFLHQRILRGRYEPSASDLGVAIDGGAFNCVSATLLYCLLAERCGVVAVPMSVPGHVWCRVEGSPVIDIESTSRDWFAIRAKYRGIPTSQVSAAMAKHRRRLAFGRTLDDAKLLAVLHFNRGVTRIHEGRLPAAAWENLQAVALDPECRPARENLQAVARKLPRKTAAGDLHETLIGWAIERAVAGSDVAIAD